MDSLLICPNHLPCNPEPDIDVSIPHPAHMTTSDSGDQCDQATNGGPLSGVPAAVAVSLIMMTSRLVLWLCPAKQDGTRIE